MIPRQSIPNFILYVIIIFLGMFFVLCSLCVGTYFYKHCIKQVVISEQKENFDPSNVREGYSGLGEAILQESNNRRDLVYLEPVDSYNADYEEIADSDSNETFYL